MVDVHNVKARGANVSLGLLTKGSQARDLWYVVWRARTQLLDGDGPRLGGLQVQLKQLMSLCVVHYIVL